MNNGIIIEVDGTKLKHHDPLMLMENTWSDFTLNKYYKAKTEGDFKKAQKHYAANLIHEGTIKIGREVAEIKQHFNPFILKYSMTIPDTQDSIDRRLLISAGILLAALEGRQQ